MLTTLKQATAELKAIGMVIRKTDYGEYRINVKGGDEATAYYTPDIEDAVLTALVMKK